MLGLVLVLWAIYLSECFVRWTPGCWVFRSGSPRPFVGTGEPDVTFFNGRLAFVWTSPFPWDLAYRFTNPAGGAIGEAAAFHERVPRASLLLRVTSTLLFALVMLVFPWLLWMEWFVPALPYFAAVLLVTWLCTWTLFVITHRRIYGRMPDAESWVMATLSPLTLMRAPMLVSIDVSPGTHPAAAAHVLCGDEEFLRIARLWHYDVPESRLSLERLATARGLDRDLAAPPISLDEDASVFCPRCHATYLLAAVKCADCADVVLLPLSLGAHGRQPAIW